jgi:uncharacterized protein YdhG (YjbR/CyaY superfamily)
LHPGAQAQLSQSDALALLADLEGVTRASKREAVGDWSMANEVDDYLASLPEPQRGRIAELYAEARSVVPEATEGLSYAMPALLYKRKGILSVMSTKKHIGIYPFANLAELDGAARDGGLETTKGSIHLRDGQNLPPGLLEQLLLRRVANIDAT